MSEPGPSEQPGLAVREVSATEASCLSGLRALCIADLAGRRGAGALLSEPWFGLAREQAAGTACDWIASWHGVDIGFASACLAGEGSSSAVVKVTSLWVDPSWRELGAGGALCEAIRDWAVENGAVALDAPALPGDRALKRLFEAAGFKARLVVMRAELGYEAR